jgi:tRNA threonylcarbamoyladenosine biosynthesis protein TsaE
LKNWSAYTLTDLPQIAKEIVKISSQIPSIWLFRGQMGTGKTTLIKEICKQMGVEHSVQSPTFSLVNEYQTKNATRIFHFDLYRLKNTQEALAIGIEDYLDSGNICLIEWPEQAEELWDIPHTTFSLSLNNEYTRNLEMNW